MRCGSPPASFKPNFQWQYSWIPQQNKDPESGKLPLQRDRQLLNSTPDFASVQRREPQLQSFLSQSSSPEAAERNYLHISACRGPRRRFAIYSRLEKAGALF